MRVARGGARSRRSGFSLVEMLMVFVIMAGLFMLLFMVYPKVAAARRADAEAQHVGAIVAGVKQLYANGASYASLSNVELIRAKILPEDMKFEPDGRVGNVWGGSMAAGPAGGGLRFQLAFDSVPKFECVKLATSVAPSMTRVEANGVAVFDRTGAGGAALDLDPATLAAACSEELGNKLALVVR